MKKPDVVEHYEEMLNAGGSLYFDPVELDEIYHYYIESGDQQRVADVLGLAKELHPEDIMVRQMDAEYLLNTGDAGGALEMLDTFFDRTNPFLCILRSAALAKLDRQAEAIEMARLASLDEDPSEYISYDLGLGFMNAEQYPLALHYYKRSLRNHPDDLKTLSGILYSKCQLGEFDGVAELADKIIGLDPFHYEAWLAKGNYLAQEKRYEEAYEAFDYAIAIFPDDPEAYIQKGRVKDEEGKHDEARQLLQEALDKSEGEQNASLQLIMAGLLNFLGDKEHAAEAVWKSLEGNDTTVTSLLKASYAFKDIEKYTEAITLLRAADEKEPDSPEILHLLGECYNAIGMYEEASDTYARLCKAIEPNAMSLSLWASVRMSLGDYSGAYKLLYDANKKEPLWTTYILMTACDIEQENYTRMESDFRLAYALNPDESVALLEKICPDMMKQMRENGFIEILKKNRNKQIARIEKEYIRKKIQKKKEDTDNKPSDKTE